MIKKIRSIRAKFILGMLPIVVLAFVTLAIIVAISAKGVITGEIVKKTETQVEMAKSEINRHLSMHEKLPLSLSKTVEAMSITPGNKSSYIDLVKKITASNEDTIATGIFMAEKYDGAYFCPYAHKDGSSVKYTEDYFKDNTNEEWYKVAEKSDSVEWSEPYYDPVIGVTMVTATAPIKDGADQLIGVATGDMNFTNIQKFVSGIKVGQNGYAMLISKDGYYLSKGKEEIKIDDSGAFPSITADDNASLAALGTEAITKQEGKGSFTDKNGKYISYYSQIPETGWIVLLSIPASEIHDPVNAIMEKIILVTVITLVILIGLVSYLCRGITKPLKPLQEEIEAVSCGDFTRNITGSSADEIGRISTSINHMVKELRKIMNDILNSSSSVASTSEELEASAFQNSQAAEQVASAVTGISETNMEVTKVTQELDEIINSIRNSAENITKQMDSVTEALLHANGESRDGGQAVKQLIDAMGQVFDDIRKLSLVMVKLMDKSRQINQIAETIQEISNQTNLLALNASIEAARAGDAGKGFAVVAEEIYKLAEQSSNSADDISVIISEVTIEAENANDSTAALVTSISSSKSALQEVGDAFSRIAAGVSEIDELTRDADRIAREIGVSSEHANTSASRLGTLTEASAEQSVSIAASAEEQLASVEEQTSATSSLAQIAEELKDKISVFRI